MSLDIRPFALDEHPAKAVPALIARDERHFVRIAASLERQIDVLAERLETQRRAPGGRGQEALDRDLEIHRLTARLRLLRRFGLDLCLGRMVREGDPEPRYVGRLALTDEHGELLLIDWRAPAAEPFFGATHGNPMGLTSRRRYRWTGGRITDFWDEVFTPDGLAGNAALDDQSAFIASLGTSRTARMRDVLGTIQADQDAIIRVGSRGALVVDGGPGTGKTVVALHRAAYLLYADPRLQDGRGGVLFVGPSHAYTAYVSDVLPGLGEEGVRTCTLADLLPEGRVAHAENDAAVALLKADARMVAAVEEVVRLRERPPTTATTIDTAWGGVRVTVGDWDEAFGAADPASTHNEAREEIWQALLGILADKAGGAPASDGWGEIQDERSGDDRSQDEGWGDAGTTAWDDERRVEASARGGFDDEDEFDAYGVARGDREEGIRRAIAESERLRAIFDRAWPLLDPASVTRELWTSPTLLRRCAPWLDDDGIAALQRLSTDPWTRADLPLLDAARLRIGDPEAAIRRRREEAEAAAERDRMADVVADLIATDDSDMHVMSMLRGQDLRSALAASAMPSTRPDSLAGPFAHIVVDEAQELTDAAWLMLLRRNPSRSFTIVGDRAQARHGFAGSWQQRLGRIGIRDVTIASLTINYRTPEEVMDVAAPVIRAAIPDANVPMSIRRSGIPVRHGATHQLHGILETWLAEHAEGVAGVIGIDDLRGLETTSRVQALTPESAKGLEFDLVVLIDPERFGVDLEGAVDRYVAMTRATSELIILSSG